MSNDFEAVVGEASKDIWNIVLDLLHKEVNFETILRIPDDKRKELEELQHSTYGDSERIAVNFAKDALKLNLTTDIIEEKTGVDRSSFIRYMKEEGDSRNKVEPDCNARDKRKKKAGKITTLNYNESDLAKENKKIIDLLSKYK
ncbi:hypothetical protein [Oceanobacillus picturae]|uniref:hypothetical protein n=1 Tax=Oceanobacillus picturae TaxID=171693 RepID=UPI00363E3F0D